MSQREKAKTLRKISENHSTPNEVVHKDRTMTTKASSSYG